MTGHAASRLLVTWRQIKIALFGCCLSLSALSPAYATPTGSPCEDSSALETLQEAHAAFSEVHSRRLPGPQGTEQLHRDMVRLAMRYANLDRFAREVLGELDKEPPERREQWRQKLIDAVQLRYFSRLEHLETGRIEVVGARGDCTNLELKLELGSKKRPAMVRLERQPQGWLAYDFGLDEVSLRELWRQRLQKAYREEGAKGLERHLERLVKGQVR